MQRLAQKLVGNDHLPPALRGAALPLFQGESGFTLPLIEGESRAFPRGRGSLTHYVETVQASMKVPAGP